MGKGNKSKILVHEQTREVYMFMINESKQRKDIIQYFVKKWTDDKIFGDDVTTVSKHRSIDNYIKKVKQTFFNFEREVQSEKGRSLARLDDLYQKLVKIQDYKGALSVLREINELTGVKAPQKVINENVNYNTEVTRDEAKEINRALENEY